MHSPTFCTGRAVGKDDPARITTGEGAAAPRLYRFVELQQGRV
jgi:hypothetical protein